ncbi:hypothetical protein CW731_04725 [Polaribacter sp. ALD11]|uniref:heavy-metal-associated domain-containing protein n=1 Tax=Polaribacter sp. ALD11 TaxID=2058137 RepID=UPI000C30A800|nr:heavy metal-associated domain-containing protein [Polaribacter sp. ALD11]AUC84643.1 hypothetical protein CW731_04725 [Polaribacter sp. ALD11]
MSLINENVIPGNHGKVFSTNAKSIHDLEKIRAKILELKGVKNVLLDLEVFPREFTIHTSKLITINEIEEKVLATGFHAIQKNAFEL